jgi:hypothetical protein
MVEPHVLQSPGGIPELGVPPGAFVLWWPTQMRWVLYEPKSYDHGVILNQLMLDNLVEVTPGPGLVEALRLAAAAGGSPSPSSPGVPAPADPLGPRSPVPLRLEK